MTGNRDDGEGGGGGARGTAAACAGWLEPMFLMLKAKMEEAAQKVCTTEIEDAAAAEKVARQIGVIARSAICTTSMAGRGWRRRSWKGSWLRARAPCSASRI